MKRFLLIALAVVMILALCACDKEQTGPNAQVGNSSSSGATGTTDSSGGSEESGDPADPGVTSCNHTYTETVTKEATCAEEGIKTFTCGKCNDTYTEPIPKAEHTYADATCTAPKTCSGCGVTQGDALGHSYKDGKCTRCNAKQENYKALNTGRWQLMALSNNGELCKFSLYLQKDRQELICGFGAELSTLDPEFQKDLLEHPEMLVEFEGKKYYFGMGDGCELTYSDGAKVEIKLMDSDSRTEYESTIVLERIAGDQLKVASVTGQVLGTGAVKEGMIFTWAE